MTDKAADREDEAGAPAGEARERPPLARYANYFEVGHNAFEFLVDCGQVEPQSGDVRLLARIVIGPVHAKLLATLLGQSIDQYERAHGEIPDLVAAAAADPDFILTNPLEFERLAIDARRRPIAARPPSTER